MLLPCSPLDEEHDGIEQSYFGEENFCDANNQNNLILADDENRFLDTYGGSGNPPGPPWDDPRNNGNQLNINGNVIISNALVESHRVAVDNVLLTSEAKVQSNLVNVHNEILMNEAIIESNKINIQQNLIDSNAIVQSHKINVYNDILDSNAVVQSHRINILNEEEWLNGRRQEGETSENQDVHSNEQDKRKEKRNKNKS